MLCKHCGSDKMIVKKKVITNGIQLRYQCDVCGEVDGKNLPQKDYNLDLLPFIDEEAKENCRKREIEARQEERLQLRSERFNNLQNYYASEQWHRKRDLRMRFNEKYFNGFCERCFKNKAEHVHHKSYEILDGKEHIFDLECLCEACHKMLHPHMQ